MGWSGCRYGRGSWCSSMIVFSICFVLHLVVSLEVWALLRLVLWPPWRRHSSLFPGSVIRWCPRDTFSSLHLICLLEAVDGSVSNPFLIVIIMEIQNIKVALVLCLELGPIAFEDIIPRNTRFHCKFQLRKKIRFIFFQGLPLFITYDIYQLLLVLLSSLLKPILTLPV